MEANAIKIDGDTAQRLYIVDSDGSMKDEANMTFDGSKLSITGAIDISSTLDVAGAASLASTLDVTGAASFASTLDVTGAASLASTLDVTGAASLSSTLDVDGLATFNAGVEISGDKLELTGSFDVKGDSALDGALSVSGAATFNGAADFNAGISVDSIKIDSDVAQRLYIVGSDGAIKDEANMVFDGSKLSITGALDISNASDLHGNVHAYADIDVDGNANVDGTLDVAGAAALASTLDVTGAVSFSSTLDVTGAASLSSTLDVSGNASFHGNVDVDGDLRVKGSMTYIDTANMRVQDAFIYLATGSAGTTDSGIVLHGGAGAGMDLVIGQDGGAGEVIFGKMDRSPDGDGAMNEIALVPAWMASVKLSDVEGGAGGSLAYDPTGAGEVALSASSALKLSAHGSAFQLASSGEQAAFEAQFGAVSLVSAIISAASGGNFKQDAIMPGAVAAGSDISFAAIGSLRAEEIASNAAKKVAMDVYLNGVRLAFGDDYSIPAVDKLHLTMDAVEGDRLFIVLHNAA